MTLRKPLTVVIGAIAAVTMIAGCSSSGGGSGEDFCTQGEKIMNVDENDEQAMADAMKKLADVAPADIKDDLKFLADTYGKMVGVDQDDPAAMMAALDGVDLGRMMEVASSLPDKIADLCE